MKTQYNKILLAIIFIGLCCALALNVQRHAVEQAATTVESAVEYRALARMADMEGMTEEALLQKYKQAGVTTLALYDQSINSLAEKGAVLALDGVTILEQKQLGTLDATWQQVVANPHFTTDAVYVLEGSYPHALDDILADATIRLGKERCREISSSPRIVQLTGDTIFSKGAPGSGEQRGIRELELGLSSDELALAKSQGFLVMARPVNYTAPLCETSAPAKEQVDSFFARLDASGAQISSFSPAGKETLGYRHNLDYVAEQLLQRKITLSMVEGVTQLQFLPMQGLTDLAKLMNYQVARTYTIDKAEQKKLTVYAAFRRWALSDEERNIRINLLRTFMEPQEGKSLLRTNLDYVREVNASVYARGYGSGKASIIEPLTPASWSYIPLAFAAMAAWGLYWGFLTEAKSRCLYGWTLGMGALLSASFFTPWAVLGRQMVALAAATIFPVLSIHLMLQQWEKQREQQLALWQLILLTTGQLIVAVALSLVGAAIIGAVLGDIRFFLEIDIYKGVKLTFILPIVLMACLYFKQHALWAGDKVERSVVQRLAPVLEQGFNLKILLGLGVLGFIAWVFVGRSGHTAGVPVPDIEIKLRYFLEQAMYARPREKEFLVGHPAFYLAAYAVYKKMPALVTLALTLAATIGQGSLVQTFAHMRTPIIMSYVRAADGILLGAPLGIALLLVFAFSYPYLVQGLRRLQAHE